MKKLDLHGLTLEEAFDEFTDFIYEAYTNNLSKVEIVTGKSGQIKKEFPYWSENNHQIKSICFSVIAVPKFATTFSIPNLCKLITSI